MAHTEQEIRAEVARHLRAQAADFSERGLIHQAADADRLAKHVEHGGVIDPQLEFNAKYALDHRARRAKPSNGEGS